MVSITQALQQIKDDLLTCLSRSSIQDVCGQLGYRWRAGKLDPVATVYAFIVQILFGNTACSELPHLLGATFSASAYCQARKRLPLALLQRLLLDLCAQVRTKTSGRGQWRGHRTFLVDGSSCSMSDTPTLQRRFGQPSVQKAGCGFPTSHMLMLFDITTGMLVSLIPSKCQTHDLSNVAQMHPHLRRGDLLVGDRAFGAYVHLAMLVSAGIEGLFRLNQRVITDFQPGRPHNQRSQANRVKGRPASRWIKQLGDDDQLVEYHRPRQRSAFLDDTAFDALPDTLVV